MGGHFCDWIHKWKVKAVQGSIIVSVDPETLDIGDGMERRIISDSKSAYSYSSIEAQNVLKG